MAQAQALLAAEESERRRRVVFIVDEAHLLSPEQLEEIRLLTSAEMDSRTPFALLLVGQPTLVRRLRMGVFAALDQRIATRYQLRPMDLAESAGYLRHHLLPAALFGDDPAGLRGDGSAAVDGDGSRLNSECARTSTAALVPTNVEAHPRPPGDPRRARRVVPG